MGEPKFLSLGTGPHKNDNYGDGGSLTPV